MAHYVCPCCGQRFNGKKCKNCYYETFDDEIERSLHTHREVNKLDVPSSRAGHVSREDWERQKRDFRLNQQKKRNQKRKLPKWLVWVLVFFLIEPVLGIAVELIDSISSGASYITREPSAPEPDAVIPADAQLLFCEDGFTLYLLEPNDYQPYPLILENTTDQDVHLSARTVVVDGFLSSMSSAWIDAPAGTARAGILSLDEEDLALAGIAQAGKIEVTFCIYDTEEYMDQLETTVVLGSGETAPAADPGGEVLLDTEDIQLRYLGYAADEYNPEFFCEGMLLFYLKNKGENTLSVYANEMMLNGQECDLAFWCEIPGNTRTVSYVWLYSAEDLGIKTLEQANQLELRLAGYDHETGQELALDPVTVNLN